MAQARSTQAIIKARGKNRESVTYSIGREDEISSKIFITVNSNVCPTGSGTISIHV